MNATEKVNYRSAAIEDLDFLVQSRLEFIQIPDTDLNYQSIKRNIRQYFEKGFRENQCDIILAEMGGCYIRNMDFLMEKKECC